MTKKKLTDAEEADIQRRIASDPDNPELTDEELAGLRPFREVLPQLAEAMDKTRRWRPRLPDAKQAVTLRLAPATLAKFKATGKDWRAKMGKVLDKAKV